MAGNGWWMGAPAGAVAALWLVAVAALAQPVSPETGGAWLRYACAPEAEPCPDAQALRHRIEGMADLPAALGSRRPGRGSRPLLEIELGRGVDGKYARLRLLDRFGVRTLPLRDEAPPAQLDAIAVAATLLLDSWRPVQPPEPAPPVESRPRPAAAAGAGTRPPSPPAPAGPAGPGLWLSAGAGPANGLLGGWGAAASAGLELAWPSVALGASGLVTTNNRMPLARGVIAAQLWGGQVHGCWGPPAPGRWLRPRACLSLLAGQLTVASENFAQARLKHLLWYAPGASAELMGPLSSDRLHWRLGVFAGLLLRPERFAVRGAGAIETSPLAGRVELGLRLRLD